MTAKKEHELLELYRLFAYLVLGGNINLSYKTQIDIVKLEKELEEMK